MAGERVSGHYLESSAVWVIRLASMLIVVLYRSIARVASCGNGRGKKIFSQDNPMIIILRT